MATNDYNMDVETQRRIEYTRQKVVKIEQMDEQLRKLNKSNRSSEEKLERLLKRKESLELDVARLNDASMRAEPEVGAELLRSIEEPMEVDMIYGEAYCEKMCHLKVLLNEIIVRTSINEKAMCEEIGHQEAEFENRLKDAINGRALLRRKTDEAQEKYESLLREQANVYEDVREMEENIEKFDASRWLLNVEKRRVSDILDRTKREPKIGIDCRKPYIVASEASSIEELVTSSASLTHDHYAPDHHFEKSQMNSDIHETMSFSNIPPVDQTVIHHKEGCPKNKKNQMGPIQHSDSLISAFSEKQETKKACRVHGKPSMTLPINGINLLELISSAIQDELSSL
uniref:Coiled-coil domain-containing protein 83 n=1 Tax=Caenorhabditis tropicalis TaxID=1561998 RepID=A0A1I7TMB7_9PELO